MDVYRARKVKTAPTKTPITLEDAKIFCDVESDYTDDDSLLRSLINAATSYVEQETGRKLVNQTWYDYYSDWPAPRPVGQQDYLELSFAPLVSVTSVKYTDNTGDESTFDSDNYIADINSEPGRVVLKYGVSYPSVSLQDGLPIVIEYVVGYGDKPDLIPYDLSNAIKLLVDFWHENRSMGDKIPLAVQSIINNYKIYFL